MPRPESPGGYLDVGARIKVLRGNLSQADFAARLGVDRKSVVGWEAGKRLPDGKSLLRLMTEFGADVNYILTGTRTTDSQAAPLAPDERTLLDNYRNSPPDAKAAIKAAADPFSPAHGAKVSKPRKAA